MRKHLLFGLAFLLAIAALTISASGQGFPELALLSNKVDGAFAPAPAASQDSQQDGAAGSTERPAPGNPGTPQNPEKPVTVIPGTHVLIALTSPLHSVSGTAGSGVYLEVVAPVVQQDRVVIPAHTYVQGTVEGNKRPGHFNRGSEFRIRFTTMIFPNNSVAAIDGILQSVPGSRIVRSQGREGTVRTVDQTEKILIPAAAGAVGGAILGSVARLGVGTFVGAGLGAGLGAGGVLLQRGDEINLPAGARLEMELRSQTVLSPEQAKFNAGYIPPRPGILPASPPAPSTPARERQQQHRNHPPLLWPLLGGALLR